MELSRCSPLPTEWESYLIHDPKVNIQPLHYPEITCDILAWLIRLKPPAASDFLLDAIETAFALIPEDELARVPDPDDYRDPNWRSQRMFTAWLDLTRQFRGLCPQVWTDAHHVRLWRLLRWMDEPIVSVPIRSRLRQTVTSALGQAQSPSARPSIPRHRPALEETLYAHRAGVATEADILDHLLGPRPASRYSRSFDDLWRLSARKPDVRLNEFPILQDLVGRCRQRILDIELRRGDLPTAATQPALSLRSAGSMETLLRLLRAFTKEELVHSRTYDSQGKEAVFSHLVRVTFPVPSDMPEAFAAHAADLPAKRLIELAVFAPQWAAHVEAALTWPGLAEGAWWIHAHTKSTHWTVDPHIREEWVAQISERTPLSAQDLLDGAVDVTWFNRVHEELGAERWQQLSEAAMYASDGQGHTRAQLFAAAMLGQVDPQDIVTRIIKKRHQDSVRALGLLPIKEEQAALERYETLQEFVRGARKFGSQRQASEKLAARIGLANLARTAGYADPVRLEWAMETQAVADLADGSLTVAADGVAVTLAINDLGEASLSVARNDRPLKTIPPKVKKLPAIAALIARKTDLERQTARMRRSLEEAMCRGDQFTGAELQSLFKHPLLTPVLESLVFVGVGLIGYPIKKGKALESHNGETAALKKRDAVRIAHSSDLLGSGEWHAWQRECFLRERIQPFKQVFRELYVLTETEKEEATLSRRYAGHQVNPKQAAALLTGRGWAIRPDEGASRTYHDENVTAWLEGMGLTLTPADVEGMTIEGTRFTRRGEWKPLNLTDVPSRVFSETMRDIDLIVSVAHCGGVDPEASASALEMRANLLRETCVLLKLGNVRLNNSFALIEGQLSSYSVHLGSGTVHQQPGGAVCIVPVQAQHRGRLFLPFVDDDPRTAETLSKVILLARDSEIQDPTILEQILRR